jgi:formate--tetrahydrofolate ligase
MNDIHNVAASLGISADQTILWGRDKAKLDVLGLEEASAPLGGRLVLVTALTPTEAGEGKTTMAIALADGLRRIGQRAALALREPSLGPVFGRKGGATGGGLARLEPSTDIDLHFTGDFHAITSAHNLLAALIDNALHFGESGLDARSVRWRRVLDVNDRSLRSVLCGLGGAAQGVPRESGFDITPASEVMAALCLARNASDLRERLSRMVVGASSEGHPVTAAEIGGVGAMMALLRDAMLPNLVQTLEGTPALLHGGPFANIAHGCNSVIATRAALRHADWVVTEAGFGADLGAEKFVHLKLPALGHDLAACVFVATIRALRRHGGAQAAALMQPDLAATQRGFSNVDRHLRNLGLLGIRPVVALNAMPGDSEPEVDWVLEACRERGLRAAVCEGYARGGAGATALAEAVVTQAASQPAAVRPLFDGGESVRARVERLALELYGAAKVQWSARALKDLDRLAAWGHAAMPVCVAKTPMSFSADPSLVGAPEGFELPVAAVELSAGAGFAVAIVGDLVRMPGLPRKPRALSIDLRPDGTVVL